MLFEVDAALTVPEGPRGEEGGPGDAPPQQDPEEVSKLVDVGIKALKFAKENAPSTTESLIKQAKLVEQLTDIGSQKGTRASVTESAENACGMGHL